MSIKIKSIEIEAFRAYQEKQIFDFVNSSSNKLANLVVIYAPNGFGKTSLYDAVEWSFTGKINRISKNTNIRNIADEEQGSILRNTKSERNFGRVKIIGDNNNILEIQTKIVGQSNRKTDYSEGNEINISEGFQEVKRRKNDFTSVNLLAHDTIDAFLRFSTPKERYDVLSNFWDSNDDTKIYKTIVAINKEVVKKEEHISDEIKNLQKDLTNISFSHEKLQTIISLIKKFNLNSSGLLLQEDIYNNIKFNLEKSIQYRTNISELNREVENKLIYTNSLKLEYSTYIEYQNKVTLINGQRVEFENILVRWKELENSENKLEELNDKLIKGLSLLEKYNKVFQNLNNYNAIDKVMKNIYTHNHQLQIEITNVSLIISNIEKDININNTLIKEIEVKINENIQVAQLINIKYIEYKNFNYKRELINRRISTLNTLISIREKKIKDLQISIEQLTGYLKLDKMLIKTTEYNYGKYKQELLIVRNTYLEYYEFNKKLEEKQNEYIQFGKINEQLNEVIKYGKTIAEELHTTKCPLCNIEHFTFESLMISINSNIEDTLGLEKISIKINEMKLELLQIETRYLSQFEVFKNHLINEIELLTKLISKENLHINFCKSLISNKKSRLKEIEKDLLDITTYFSLNKIDIHNFEAARQGLINQIALDEQSLKQHLPNKELKQNELEKQQELLKINNDIIQLNNLRLAEQTTNPLYIEVSSLLNNLNINIDTNISQMIKEIESKVLSYSQEIEILKNSISLSKRELFELDDVKELGQKIIKLNNDILIANDWITTYKNRYSNLISNRNDEVDLNKLNDFEIDIKRKIELNQNILNNLTEILEHINYLNENKDWIDKNSKLIELKKDLEKVSNAKLELLYSKKIGAEFITNRINEYFNLNIINQIYSKIDPHPESTYVDFEPDFTNDNPELNVHAYNDERTNKIAPILYLSSAQVNILSLSIFLARSLQGKNYILNTIFMDDPVQHLDSINTLSFIDLLRTIITDLDRQIIISTHSESFYNLIKRKIDPDYFDAKFIELKGFGQL